MIITQTWVQVATASCLVTRNGTRPVSLCYASSSPTTEATIAVETNLPQQFPTVSGRTLWAKAIKGDVSLTVNIL